MTTDQLRVYALMCSWQRLVGKHVELDRSAILHKELDNQKFYVRKMTKTIIIRDYEVKVHCVAPGFSEVITIYPIPMHFEVCDDDYFDFLVENSEQIIRKIRHITFDHKRKLEY